jgi:hypothetical protein
VDESSRATEIQQRVVIIRAPKQSSEEVASALMLIRGVPPVDGFRLVEEKE